MEILRGFQQPHFERGVLESVFLAQPYIYSIELAFILRIRKHYFEEQSYSLPLASSSCRLFICDGRTDHSDHLKAVARYRPQRLLVFLVHYPVCGHSILFHNACAEIGAV